MADDRSRREKLAAMAAQTSSPAEAAVARRKLAEMGARTQGTPEASLDARLDRLRSIVMGYSPGLRVRVVASSTLDDLYADPALDWDGVS